MPLEEPTWYRRGSRVDLYAGAGGPSLGIEQAGFHVIAAAELSSRHAPTHRRNFPDTPVLTADLSRVQGRHVVSVAKLGWRRIHPETPFPSEIDLVAGGPPCQGFSVGGRRDPNDIRNDQLLNFVRLVSEVRPKTFLLENVGGQLEDRFRETRDAAWATLRDAGYSVHGAGATVLASDWGVPQNRRRVIIVGSRVPEADVQSLSVAPMSGSKKVTVREALEGLPEVSTYPELLSTDVLARKDRSVVDFGAVSSDYAAALSGKSLLPEELSADRRWNLNRLSGLKRTVHHEETVARFAETPQGKSELKSRLYRLALDGQARTLRAGTGPDKGSHTSPRPIHPVEPRVVLAREAARLHGYPDWFEFDHTVWWAHQQIGNSVPPPLARAAASRIMRALNRSEAAAFDSQ